MLSDTARSALATLGRAQMAYHRPRDFHDLMHPRFAVDDDGLYRLGACTGLAQSEAIGLTLVIRWAELAAAGDDRMLVRQFGPDLWAVKLPGADPDTRSTAEALPIVRALQTCRRIVWPTPRPWTERDMVLEHLEHAARRMDAALRPRPSIEVLRPAVNTAPPSDLGRDWRR